MTTERKLRPADRPDEAWFEEQFRQFFAPLMGFAKKILGDEEEAREVVQRVFINLWERREKVDLETPLKSYLFTSVRHRSLNVIRDRRKISGDEIPDLAQDWDVSAQIESMELEQRVRDAIGTLPEKCREIFQMSRFDGLKYSEIAEHLGISVRTVENQVSKALKLLREKLAEYLTLLLWILLHGMN